MGPNPDALHTASPEHVLIDYENVQPTLSEWNLLQGTAYKVTVFLGPKQATVSRDLVLAMQKLGGEYIAASIVGKNAVDFHIAYYLGKLSCEHPSATFHIISRDKGFDALLQHLKVRNLAVSRFETVAEIPSMKAVKERKRTKLVGDARAFLAELDPFPRTREELQTRLRSRFRLGKQRLDELMMALDNPVTQRKDTLEYLPPPIGKG